LSKLN
jgi:hypothetical protein